LAFNINVQTTQIVTRAHEHGWRYGGGKLEAGWKVSEHWVENGRNYVDLDGGGRGGSVTAVRMSGSVMEESIRKQSKGHEDKSVRKSQLRTKKSSKSKMGSDAEVRFSPVLQPCKDLCTWAARPS